VGDDELLRVLHALRLVGFSDTHRLTVRLGSDPADVDAILRHSETSLFVTQRSGRVSGWTLTAVGRAHGEHLLAAELDALGTRSAVVDGYQRFLAVNQRFLDLCTDWQLRPDHGGVLVVNDHTDSEHDAAVLARLALLDDVIQPIVADLAAVLDRFGGYGRRFARARRNIEAGERDWFTRPLIDSYHTVWFELHEDLLATLGLERSSEH
jgi:hypothetical protein